MNTKSLLALSLSAITAFAFAEDSEEPSAAPVTESAPAKPAKPEKVKKPSVTLKLSQYPLISKSDDSNKHNNNMNRGMFQSRSKTSTYQMKWDCSVRVRERVPEGLKLEVYYIGQNAENKWVQIGETKTVNLSLDDKGTWSGELLSPETTWIETKQQRNRNFNNNGGQETPEKQGERIKGCVARVVGEGVVWKSYASDSRWAKAAKKDSFSVQDIK